MGTEKSSTPADPADQAAVVPPAQKPPAPPPPAQPPQQPKQPPVVDAPKSVALMAREATAESNAFQRVQFSVGKVVYVAWRDMDDQVVCESLGIAPSDQRHDSFPAG